MNPHIPSGQISSVANIIYSALNKMLDDESIWSAAQAIVGEAARCRQTDQPFTRELIADQLNLVVDPTLHAKTLDRICAYYNLADRRANYKSHPEDNV